MVAILSKVAAMPAMPAVMLNFLRTPLLSARRLERC
jgi:hypothetical protein